MGRQVPTDEELATLRAAGWSWSWTRGVALDPAGGREGFSLWRALQIARDEIADGTAARRMNSRKAG